MTGNTRRGYPLYQVDAFTGRAFRGNPAAVCLLRGSKAGSFFQDVAAEMNLSETAFLWPLRSTKDRPPLFALRWFTPTNEVPLCGHATVAAAAVLFREVGLPQKEVRFKTLSGELRASRVGGRIIIDLPEHSPRPTDVSSPLLNALGLRRIKEAVVCREGNLLIRLPDGLDVRRVRPDFQALGALRIRGVSGVIVTSRGKGPYDFVSRYFCPWDGIAEDPVTGSAHCLLAPYWAGVLNKDKMRAFQASARGGELWIRRERGRVLIGAQAVVVSRGELRTR